MSHTLLYEIHIQQYILYFERHPIRSLLLQQFNMSLATVQCTYLIVFYAFYQQD